MSVYLIKGKGWRFDFTLKGTRHTEAWFKTKRAAVLAEAKRKEELLKPTPPVSRTKTDMGFLELVNRRLDHVKAYKSDEYYKTHVYLARRWVSKWGNLFCSQIDKEIIKDHHFDRRKISAFAANKDLRYLRATFNFGIAEKLITMNPTNEIDYFPLEKRAKYTPPANEIDAALFESDLDTQEYLVSIQETLARVSEINRMTWSDINFEQKYVVLYTRKKRGGHLSPRKVPMTEKLYQVLSRRYQERDRGTDLVFWHRYVVSETGQSEIRPFKYRRTILKTVCKKAGVKRFTFHALRHSGASIMDENNVPLGSIQRILGHENRTTTEIYLHGLGEGEREAMSVFESARKKSHTQSHTDKKKG